MKGLLVALGEVLPAPGLAKGLLALLLAAAMFALGTADKKGFDDFYAPPGMSGLGSLEAPLDELEKGDLFANS